MAGKAAREPGNIVGPRVARLRYQLGLPQTELAAKCQRAGRDASRGITAGIEGQVRCVTDREFVLLPQLATINAGRPGTAVRAGQEQKSAD